MIGTGRRARPRPLLRRTLGEVLRRNRQAQGRTLSDVARTARVSMQYLSELERGVKEASSEVLAALCDALDIDLADLLDEVGRALVEDRERGATVVRMEVIRTRQRSSRAPGTGSEPLCLLAA